MREMTKMILMIILLESPLFSFLLLKDFLVIQLYKFTAGNVFMTRVLFFLVFIIIAMVTGFMFIIVHWSAQASVGGKQFLVGHVYKRNQIAEDLQLEFGERTELPELTVKINGKSQTWYPYVIWKMKEEERIANYVLLSPVPIQEALIATSKWTIATQGWWAEAEGCYPVTLFELEGKAVDVIREKYKLPAEIPIYVLRDYPGRIKVDLIEEPTIKPKEKEKKEHLILTEEDKRRLGIRGGPYHVGG